MIKEVSNSKDWNNFLFRLNPNTFLQSWEWGEVQRLGGENVRYLGIFEGDVQVGACLLLTVNARRGRHLFVPHGPILAPRSSGSEVGFQTILSEIVDYSRAIAKQEKAVALRISPLFIESPENMGVFHQLGFRDAPLHVHAELTWVLDINKSEEGILADMRKTTRHAIRNAEKSGVVVELRNDTSAIDRFLPLYQATKQRHDFVPYSEKTLQAQFEIFNRENHVFAVFARYQDQDIAAGIFFQFGNTVFYYHGASLKTSSKVSAAQLLQWSAIREAKRRAAARFNFWGIAPQRSEGARRSFMRRRAHPFAGITTFKKGFGGYAIPYMHAQDLPLSIEYATLWLADTYRRIKRGF